MVSRVGFADCVLSQIQTKSAFATLVIRTVTLEAAIRNDGANIAIEIDRLRLRRRLLRLGNRRTRCKKHHDDSDNLLLNSIHSLFCFFYRHVQSLSFPPESGVIANT